MNDQELNALLESLKKAHLEAKKADDKVTDIEAELPQVYWDALDERKIANKGKKDADATVRDATTQYYLDNGTLPVSPYLKTGISIRKSVANPNDVILAIAKRIVAGETDLIPALALDEAIVAEYPDLPTEWREETVVKTDVQWKAMEK